MNGDYIYILELIFGSISIASLFFVIVVFAYSKDYRKAYEFELIFYLSISEFLNILAYLIYFVKDPRNVNQTICNLQAFLIMWFEFSQYIIATLIIYHASKSINKVNLNSVTGSKRAVYLSIAYIPSFTFALSGYMLNMYGPSGPWCWVNFYDNTVSRNVYSIMAYSMMWIIIITNLALAIKSYRKLNRMNRENQKTLDLKYFRQLLIFSIIALLGILPATIDRVLFKITNQWYVAMELVHIIFFFPQGFFYTLNTIYSTNLKIEIKEFIVKNCCCCCRKKGVDKIDQRMFRSLSDKIISSDDSLISQNN
jgi:hypothetical protein